MESLITIVSVLSAVGLSGYFIYLSNKTERTRYREFVKSVLSVDVKEYNENIEEDGILPEETPNEFEDLLAVDEGILIKKLQEEHGIK